MKKLFLLILIIGLQITYAQIESDKKIIPNKWKALKTSSELGVHGERINLFRQNRLKFMLSGDFLINGFEHRPGSHSWQGEHIGKWLHSSILSIQNQTILKKNTDWRDEKLKKNKEDIDKLVDRLLSTQLENGYMGTYAEKNRFMKILESGSMGGWDVWTHRYNLYGLLTYEKYYANKKVIDACRKMGDLLIEVFGEGKADITKYGTRQGISSMTILESIAMLYERTLDKKYLDFAEHLVKISEQNNKLRLMGNMLENGSVVNSGDGKAYQLMANLLGYLSLYRCTGKEKYLTTVLNAWEQIKDKHILVSGGPWSRHTDYNGNKECFAHKDAFHPEKIFVEGCSDATWVQLNIHLHEFTGESKYFNEAEQTMVNEVYRHQDIDGYKFAYYTIPNENKTQHNPFYHCCASSEPRGMEMYSNNLVGAINGVLSINTLFPARIKLSNEFGGGNLEISGNFPYVNKTTFNLNLDFKKKFKVEFRMPANTSLNSVLVNNKQVKFIRNQRGKYEINGSWKKGDMIDINYQFNLKVHEEIGEEGKRWVAFTYGPLALAEKLNSKNDFSIDRDQFNRTGGSKLVHPEPFININTKNKNVLLDKIIPIEGSQLRFKIAESDIELMPYYKTASNYSGPRTYFYLGD
tara:strand:+ start:113 stop:2020 length:1908 start_codon:yes stop_codon:yes gene_type:complete